MQHAGRERRGAPADGAVLLLNKASDGSGRAPHSGSTGDRSSKTLPHDHLELAAASPGQASNLGPTLPGCLEARVPNRG
eukprot:1782814-Pyramimonas_sp.AAC.1